MKYKNSGIRFFKNTIYVHIIPLIKLQSFRKRKLHVAHHSVHFATRVLKISWKGLNIKSLLPIINEPSRIVLYYFYYSSEFELRYHDSGNMIHFLWCSFSHLAWKFQYQNKKKGRKRAISLTEKQNLICCYH